MMLLQWEHEIRINKKLADHPGLDLVLGKKIKLRLRDDRRSVVRCKTSCSHSCPFPANQRPQNPLGAKPRCSLSVCNAADWSPPAYCEQAPTADQERAYPKAVRLLLPRRRSSFRWSVRLDEPAIFHRADEHGIRLRRRDDPSGFPLFRIGAIIGDPRLSLKDVCVDERPQPKRQTTTMII